MRPGGRAFGGGSSSGAGGPSGSRPPFQNRGEAVPRTKRRRAPSPGLYKIVFFAILAGPTAALDPVVGFEMDSRFGQMAGEKTALCLSHRLFGHRFCRGIAGGRSSGAAVKSCCAAGAGAPSRGGPRPSAAPKTGPPSWARGNNLPAGGENEREGQKKPGAAAPGF
ncbi:hypothetical protein HMPREF0262_01640 [Clostridium sp. ATCC 29733]|nr:hypothetical protein HMPREF0262_01640 [Clostridium sp. ATCC 29733]